MKLVFIHHFHVENFVVRATSIFLLNKTTSGSTLENGNFGLRRIKLQATWGFAIVGRDVRTISSSTHPSFGSGRTNNIGH